MTKGLMSNLSHEFFSIRIVTLNLAFVNGTLTRRSLGFVEVFET